MLIQTIYTCSHAKNKRFFYFSDRSTLPQKWSLIVKVKLIITVVLAMKAFTIKKNQIIVHKKEKEHTN
jgi:hypothetical protein